MNGKFVHRLILIVILGLIYSCTSISPEKNNLAKDKDIIDINGSFQKANDLFIQTNDLPALVKNSYILLYNNLALIDKYKNKYPKIAKDLKEINQYIIEKKAKIIVENFLEERGNTIIDKYRTLNFQLIDEFETGLQEYLERVKETNGEVFVGELFGLSAIVKSVKNPDKYVERVFEERFLSKEMLADAISKYLQQLDTRLEENMNRFLVDMEAEFLKYLKEIGEMEFLFEPEDIYQSAERNRIILIYSDTKLSEELCPGKIKKEISSKLRKNLVVQGGSTLLGFVPGVNILLGLGADGAAMFYERKLRKEVESSLDQIIAEIKIYVMEPEGLNLRYEILDFINNYEEKKNNLLKEALITQYKRIQEDFFVRDET